MSGIHLHWDVNMPEFCVHVGSQNEHSSHINPGQALGFQQNALESDDYAEYYLSR